MKLYNIFYKGDANGNPYSYEATTDNFEKWLEDNNSNREQGFEEEADDFTVEEIRLFLYAPKE
tara:strand:+ start:1263 stop:1451 length:189 start_codon:yes stop_codon:yes gene_type:complete